MNLERINFLKEIIDSGRIKVDLDEGTVTTYKGIVSCPNGKGYYQTGLKCSDGKLRSFKVHEIIAVAGGMDILDVTVNHMDGNKTNNRFNNLEPLTKGENTNHARMTGLIKNFDKGKSASDNRKSVRKLSDEQVLQIKTMLGTVRQRDIARYFNVSESMISNIKHGKKKGWL